MLPLHWIESIPHIEVDDSTEFFWYRPTSLCLPKTASFARLTTVLIASTINRQARKPYSCVVPLASSTIKSSMLHTIRYNNLPILPSEQMGQHHHLLSIGLESCVLPNSYSKRKWTTPVLLLPPPSKPCSVFHLVPVLFSPLNFRKWR